MSINIASNFDLFAQLPLDARTVVADTTARDAIVVGKRYDGLCVYCLADDNTYQLQGGIANTDWKIFATAGGSLWVDNGTYIDTVASKNVHIGQGVLKLLDGSATAPTCSFISKPDTGMYLDNTTILVNSIASGVSGDNLTLNDTTLAMTVNAYTGRLITITAGTNVGLTRVIASNTATQFTVTVAYPAPCDVTTEYEVYSTEINWTIYGASRMRYFRNGGVGILEVNAEIDTRSIKAISPGGLNIEGAVSESSAGQAVQFGNRQMLVEQTASRIFNVKNGPLTGYGVESTKKYPAGATIGDLKYNLNSWTGNTATRYVVVINGNDGTNFLYDWSTDGGATWAATGMVLPTGGGWESLTTGGVSIGIYWTQTGTILSAQYTNRDAWTINTRLADEVSFINSSGGWVEGISADATDFPRALSIISQGDTGETSLAITQQGLVVESAATGDDFSSTATAGSSVTELEDTTLTMTVNEYIGRVITITAGTNIGLSRTVVSNTIDTFTVNIPYPTAPDITSVYTLKDSTEYQSHAINGIARAKHASSAVGVLGTAVVFDTANTAAAIGVWGTSTATHAGGVNIGVASTATGGAYNYAFYSLAGEHLTNGGHLVKRRGDGAGGDTLLVTDYIWAKTAITASGDILNIPTDLIGSGRMFILKDESGTCSIADPIIVLPQIGVGTLIDGDVSFTMDNPYQSITIYSNGTHWYII